MDVCQDLGTTFDYVTAALILCPPEPSPAAVPFQPGGDVIAMQLWGDMRLSVATSELVLQPGDTVFVPQRVMCRALPPTPGKTVLTPTLSVVLTLRTAEQSLGVSMGKHLTDLLLQGDKLLSPETDLFLRTAVRKRGPRDAALQNQLAKAAAEISTHLKGPALRAHFSERMAKQREEQREGAVNMARPIPPDSVTSNSMVRIARGVRCKCTGGESVAHFSRGADTLHLPIARSASHLVAGLSDGRVHRVCSLPCDDAFERVAVVQVLVHKECVEVASASCDGPSTQLPGIREFDWAGAGRPPPYACKGRWRRAVRSLTV